MKANIISILSNVSLSDNHHSAGYNKVMISMLKKLFSNMEFVINGQMKNVDEYDLIFILEGPNYRPGTYNLFGGLNETQIEKMVQLSVFKGEIISVEQQFDLNDFNLKRVKLDIQFPNTRLCELTKIIQMKTRKCVIGDSHSLSVHKDGFSINRIDGKTLFGYLNIANEYELNQKFDETITYFGNIDLRFHLARQDNPIQATQDLALQYVEFSRNLKNNTMVLLLPVEHESRKIPNTGKYQGQSFFGSREERMMLREIFNNIIINSGEKYISWPEEWVCETGEKMLSHLEPKQSVHLKPKYYATEFHNQ